MKKSGALVERCVMYRNRFLDMQSMPTCLAPWHCLTIKWGGNVVPDILYKGKMGNISKQTLPEILNGDEAKELRIAHRTRTIPESCMNCAKKEKSGRSRRMFFWDKIDFDVRTQAEHLDIDSMPDIRYLDFTVSNKCNLACIHCNPFVSTGWTKDGKKLNKEMPEYWTKQPIGYNGVKEVSFMDNLMAEPKYFRNLQWVALRGGEPLYDERCLALLQWFVDNGLSENIMLDISTNATVFNENFRELFKRFKRVELLVSIEGTDDLYSIIRGGKYTWEDLNKNIEKFYDIPNLDMVFAVTVMSTNIFNLDKVWNWFAKYHNKRASIAMTNVVVDPAYLNIANLPAELKQKALDKISNIPSETLLPAGSYHNETGGYQTGIDDIRKGLSSSEQDPKQWEYFIKYTKDLDRLRSTDTFKFIPEMEVHVNN